MKSFRPKKDGLDGPAPPDEGRNPDADFRGEKRSNATHASTTDPDPKLYRKGPGMEAKLRFIGHALMENRSGLLVETCPTQAGGRREGGGAGHDRAPSRAAARGDARGGSRLRRGRLRERTPHPQRPPARRPESAA